MKKTLSLQRKLALEIHGAERLLELNVKKRFYLEYIFITSIGTTLKIIDLPLIFMAFNIQVKFVSISCCISLNGIFAIGACEKTVLSFFRLTKITIFD